MRLGIFLGAILLFISLVPYSLEDPSQDTALATDQTWQDEYQPEEYRGEKEEEATEEGTTRKPRGKRRRRMRKRQRVQPTEESVDRVSNGGGHNQEVGPEKGLSEDENATPGDVPRRRPGKRRRRPYRRYQDEDGAPVKPPRRRRKGGRKKIRLENQEEVTQTENPQEEMRNEQEPQTTIQPIQTTISTSINSVLEEEKPTVIPREITTTPPTKKDEIPVNNDVKAENEDTDKPTGYGNKIFDRKKLFSNPRRTLPVTSAVIRKLGPGNRINNSENTTPPTELRDNYEKIINKALIKSNSVPESNTNPTEIIKPERLIHAESKVQTIENEKEVEDEEPNYPKILPRPIYRNKLRHYETTTTIYTTTTEKIETTKEPEKEIENIDPETSAMTVSEFEKMLQNLDIESFNTTYFGDNILDMLKSESGREEISKILESRNMTVTQLLEHRERGSSKFHLFEMFPQKKKQNKTTQTTTVKPTERPQQIQFPSEEVLGSFPKFVADEIEKHEQKNDNNNKIIDNETESLVNNESREPRLFDSMPEFTTLSVSTTTKDDKHPTWRVIPNPKLRPVSVRGNYEEIPISNVLNRPLENNVNDIYIVDERESIIHHKKYGLSSDRMKSKDTFGNFKKIPVGVKSAIIISGIILAVATFGFLSLLISCRVRQKRTLLRAKQDMMCEHLQNDDFMTSQQSLSPVLTKHQQVYNPHQEHHSHPHNRHYYLWRTIRRTFRDEPVRLQLETYHNAQMKVAELESILTDEVNTVRKDHIIYCNIIVYNNEGGNKILDEPEVS